MAARGRRAVRHCPESRGRSGRRGSRQRRAGFEQGRGAGLAAERGRHLLAGCHHAGRDRVGSSRGRRRSPGGSNYGGGGGYGGFTWSMATVPAPPPLRRTWAAAAVVGPTWTPTPTATGSTTSTPTTTPTPSTSPSPTVTVADRPLDYIVRCPRVPIPGESNTTSPIRFSQTRRASTRVGLRPEWRQPAGRGRYASDFGSGTGSYRVFGDGRNGPLNIATDTVDTPLTPRPPARQEARLSPRPWWFRDRPVHSHPSDRGIGAGQWETNSIASYSVGSITTGNA